MKGKDIVNEIKVCAIGFTLGAAILASFLFFGLRVKAAPADFDDLRAIPRHEIIDMMNREEYTPPEPEWVCPFSQSEIDLFAALVMAEAGDQDYVGKCLVADVVLNRLESPAWPNTLEGVIYQPGQFSPVTDGGLARGFATVNSDCYAAVHQELQGRMDYNIIYFSMWYCANGTFVYQHGDHYFGV